MLEGVDYGLSFPKVAYFKMEEQKYRNEKGEEVLEHPRIEKLCIFGGYNSAGDSYVYDFTKDDPAKRFKQLDSSYLSLTPWQ